jgi:hypothetical protein
MSMPQAFDLETIELVGSVCNDVWRDLRGKVKFLRQEDERKARAMIAARVVRAVADGERDPQRLKVAALDGLAQPAEFEPPSVG